METARINAPQKNSVPASALTESAGSSQSPASSMQSSPLYAGPPALRLSSSPGGSAQGETLQPQIRSSLESSFQVDMSAVRVHTDARSSAAADSLSARAFTYGPNIFLGSGERPSDLALMAHEGAHVVQQQSVPALQMSTGMASTDTFEQEARQTSLAVQRGEQATVRERTSNPRIQREEKEGGGLISRFLDRVVQWVKRIPGYDLVTVILGKDPISGKPVERNAVNVIRGLVSLIPGGHDMFENLQKAGTIQRAFEWFNAEIGRLNLTWESIKALIRQFWDAFSIWHPIRSIERIGEIFGPVLERLVNFAVTAGKKILEFIFEGVLSLAGSLGKQIVGIIRKAGDVFSLIVKDPIGFLKNLVQAVKGGFQNFSKNILKHLKNALFEWLFGALQGVGLILPDKFDFKGIISIILQVLGLTYARLREKLVKLIGEPAVAFIEKAFEFLKLIVTQGIAAAWQKVLEFATGLIDTVIGGIIDWATKTIVGAAITKLVTMFNPVGAIIQGIITIYNTIKFFIERAKQIASVAEAVFDSIKNIATGNISGAMDYVEKTMARFLPVVIGFLASFIGLGGIGGEIKKIIQKIQTVVDNAINKVVNFVVDKAKALIAKVTGKGKAEEKDKDKEAAGSKAVKAKVKTELSGKTITDTKQAEALISGIYEKYKSEGLKGIELVPDAKKDNKVNVVVSASVADKIAELVKKEDPRELRRIAENLVPLSARTNLYVSYAGNKPFSGSPFRNTESPPRHAEQNFLSKIPNLIAQINKDKSKGEIPPGPVLVTLDMNRSPCDGCAGLLADAASRYANDIKFKLNMVGVYKANWQSIELTSEKSWIKMHNAGIDLDVLKVWAVLKENLQAKGVQEIYYNGRYHYLNEVAGTFMTEELHLEEILKDIKARPRLAEVHKGNMS